MKINQMHPIQLHFTVEKDLNGAIELTCGNKHTTLFVHYHLLHISEDNFHRIINNIDIRVYFEYVV